MKVLFDCFTDLVTVRKELGRQLKDRTVFVVACGSEPELPEGFEMPFRENGRVSPHELRWSVAHGQTNKQGLLPSVTVNAAAFGATAFA